MSALAEFVDRREQWAKDANTPSYRTVEDYSANFTDLAAISHPKLNQIYGGPFYHTKPHADRPSTNLVFVEDINGNTAIDNPGDLGGGETDKHIIYDGLTRAYVQAVIAGVNTLRDASLFLSTWHPSAVDLRVKLRLPRHPVQVLVTESGNFSADHFILQHPNLDVIFLTGVEGARRLEQMRAGLTHKDQIKIEITGQTTNLKEGMKILKQNYGVNLASCIGGHTLAKSMLDDGVIDDIYLTQTQSFGAVPNTPFHPDRNRFLRNVVVGKKGTGEEEGVRFLHLKVR